MHYWVPFFLALCLFLQRFQIPPEGLSFVKFGNIYATEPLLQNVAKIVCLHWLTLETWIICANFLKIRVVFHTLCREWSQLPPILLAFLQQITHYLTAAKILNILINWKMFARTWLNIVLQKVLLPPPQPQSKKGETRRRYNITALKWSYPPWYQNHCHWLMINLKDKVKNTAQHNIEQHYQTLK